MVFSSVTFLFYFLPAFLSLYYLLPWKNSVLLVASLVFYAWGEPRFLPLLILYSLLNYAAGRTIAGAGRHRRLVLGIGIGANLSLLFYFKYMNFFAGMAAQVLHAHITLPDIVLPLGISFFTFQGLSYLIDVYRGEVDPQKSFWTFALYKAMFPPLIAGPIVRYRQIAAEITRRSTPAARVWRGFRQFMLGLAQKVLIANVVALPADQLFGAGAAHLSTLSAWIAVACYGVEILYDFAGYSNMAIGIGHMIGFTFPANFDKPYTALSVTDFWRRWHISLSSWFRDYVYIPLGGNRGAPWRTYANLWMVFLLCGLWHGAAWTFIIWGAWHGAWLVVERSGFGAVLARMPKMLAQAYTLLVVLVGWVFFRAGDAQSALQMLAVMFHPYQGGELPHLWQIDVGPMQWTALAIGALLACWRRPAAPAAATRATAAWHLPLELTLTLSAFVLCSASLASGTYNPFIYFHF